MHDNAPPHRCAAVEKFVHDNIIFNLPWPPQSPDLNIIENVWHYVKKELKKCKSATIRDLENNILKIWQSVPVDFIRRLIDSVPRRLAAVHRCRGYNTKY